MVHSLFLYQQLMSYNSIFSVFYLTAGFLVHILISNCILLQTWPKMAPLDELMYKISDNLKNIKSTTIILLKGGVSPWEGLASSSVWRKFYLDPMCSTREKEIWTALGCDGMWHFSVVLDRYSCFPRTKKWIEESNDSFLQFIYKGKLLFSFCFSQVVKSRGKV